MNTKRLTVIGDTLLDVEINGNSQRVCPDTDTPIVDVQAMHERPGGAGLTAILAAESLADVTLVTAIGSDAASGRLRTMLAQKVRLVEMPFTGTTSQKVRIRSNGTQIARVDSGDGQAANVPLDQHIRFSICSADVIVVADYGRGITSIPTLRQLLIELSTHKPIIWDPHVKGAKPVPNSYLVTPNELEASTVTRVSAPEASAHALRDLWHSNAVAITLGSDGVVFVGPGSACHTKIPVPTQNAVEKNVDACGAGDCFTASIAIEILKSTPIEDAVRAAVLSASQFVQHKKLPSITNKLGTSQVDLNAFDIAQKVRRQNGTLVATGGCFDLLHPGHIALLDEARSMGDALVVCLNSDESIRRLKGPERPINPAADRARVLMALKAVDAVVIFHEDSPKNILSQLNPDVWVKGSDYVGLVLPEAEVIEKNGGQVVLLPVIDGYSTTKIANLTREKSQSRVDGQTTCLCQSQPS